MTGEPGSGETSESTKVIRRIPSSAADVERWQKEDFAHRQAKKGKKPFSTAGLSHLSLDEYDPDKRRRQHVPGSLPEGTSTTGQRPPRPEDSFKEDKPVG